MTNALKEVKVEFPNANISIFSILSGKGNGINFKKCDLNKMTHPGNKLIQKR